MRQGAVAPAHARHHPAPRQELDRNRRCGSHRDVTGHGVRHGRSQSQPVGEGSRNCEAYVGVSGQALGVSQPDTVPALRLRPPRELCDACWLGYSPVPEFHVPESLSLTLPASMMARDRQWDSHNDSPPSCTILHVSGLRWKTPVQNAATPAKAPRGHSTERFRHDSDLRRVQSGEFREHVQPQRELLSKTSRIWKKLDEFRQSWTPERTILDPPQEIRPISSTSSRPTAPMPAALRFPRLARGANRP